jgi:D-alanyl-D-alanine carboxypeptidase/D-alanyl-D-alanine-endopeptidase (penicillin-binding protein 4)
MKTSTTSPTSLPKYCWIIDSGALEKQMCRYPGLTIGQQWVITIHTMIRQLFYAAGYIVAGLAGIALPANAAQGQESGVASVTRIPRGVELILSGHRLPRDSYSFLVQEVNTPEPLLAVNVTVPFNPASIIKTLTTLTALEVLGPAYTWKTEVYALGKLENGNLQGDLLLRGGGDPFLVEEKLRSMLKALQRSGIKNISGDLILDVRYFDETVSNEAAIDKQSGRAYNVQPYALLVNFQTVNFYFYPHGNGRDVIIRTDPELPNLTISNRIRLRNAPCAGYQRGISFHQNPEVKNGIIFSGEYPSACREYQMVRAVLDTSAYTYGLFQQLWRETGGEFAGKMRLGQAPADGIPVQVWHSPPLSDVLKTINKFSNNLMTRHLLLTLGAEYYGGPATYAKGVQAIHDFLNTRGIDTSGLVMVNGAGLSRETRITTQLMNTVLQLGYASSYMPEFIASLPLAGMDGTMQNRLRNPATRGRMHIKTGTLDEVSAIAGYVHARSGKYYTVSAILNHELAHRGPGVELMDALLAWVYEY